MSIRSTLVALALAAVAVYWGGTNFHTALRERTPLQISCARYLEQRPTRRYVKLTDCDADLANAAFTHRDGSSKAIGEVYIPLRPRGTTGEAAIVLVRRDAEIIDVVRMIERIGVGEPTAAEQVRLRGLLAQLGAESVGLVRFGLELDDNTNGRLAQLGMGLAPDFVLIDRGKSPRLVTGGLVLLGGLALFALVGRGIYRRLRPRRRSGRAQPGALQMMLLASMAPASSTWKMTW